jgi:DNA repair protein SbcD/Mre11
MVDLVEIYRMKLLHTADWHLGKRLERFDRMDEQRAAMDEICRIADAEDVDAVLVAGDLFDTYNPSNEATQLLYRTLKRLSKDGHRPVIAIAGNHDSPDRIEAPDPLAVECGIFFAGFPHSRITPLQLESGVAITQSMSGFFELFLPKFPFPLRILLAPYANESRLRKDLGSERPEAVLRELLESQWQQLAQVYCDDKGLNILVGHLLMMSHGDSPPDENIDEEKSIGQGSVVFTQNMPAGIQYAALGHIHSFRNMTGGPCPAVYSSSPLAFSFPKRGENVETGGKCVVIVEGEPGKPIQYRAVPLQSGRTLHTRRFPDTAAALEWLRENPECFVELHIETDHYITAEDRKQIMSTHPRVVGPIPVFKDELRLAAVNAQVIDLSKKREDLFKDYFLRKNSVEASDELMALFREVAGKEIEA